MESIVWWENNVSVVQVLSVTQSSDHILDQVINREQSAPSAVKKMNKSRCSSAKEDSANPRLGLVLVRWSLCKQMKSIWLRKNLQKLFQFKSIYSKSFPFRPRDQMVTKFRSDWSWISLNCSLNIWAQFSCCKWHRNWFNW